MIDQTPVDLTLSLIEQNHDEQVSIIVIHRDRPQYLNICLQSIAVCSVNNKYEIIVVDNGSKVKDAVDFLDSLGESECKVIRNKENLWWSKAANQGAKAADKNSKYFIFMHSDVVVTNRAWIDLFINVSESEDSGLIGTSMSSYVLENKKQLFIEETCMLVSRECYQDCGPFSEELPMIGAPFLFTMACAHAEYKPMTLSTPVIHHYGIFGVDANEFAKLSEKARTAIYPEWIKIPSRIKKRKR